MRISPTSQAYIRKRATALMHDACTIYKPGKPVLDRNTGKTVTGPPTVKYTGPCRIWEVSAGQQMLMGDEQITLTQTYLSLPFDAPVPEEDDTVQILQADDTNLVGKTVSVISTVHGGGLRASRKLLVRVVESEKDSW